MKEKAVRFLMSDNHTQGTIEWYTNWLAERRPDLSEEQRLEMATGFTQQQQPPVRKPDELQTDEVVTANNERAEQRKRARLTEKELGTILSINEPKR